MKKAILVLSVVIVLALLAVPIVAEGLATADETNRELAPRDPGTFKGAEREKNLEMSPSPRPPGNNQNLRVKEKNLQMAPGSFMPRGAQAAVPAQIAGYWRGPKPAA